VTARTTGEAELRAGLTLGELEGGPWRLELILPSAGAAKPVALPLVLDVSASGGAEVKPLAAAAADLVAKAPGRPKQASSPAKRTFLRRAAGRLRRALKK
jgi:hypothetical protein